MKKQLIIDEYPRPQARRDSFINLNGKWDFFMDYENAGEVSNFDKGFNSDKKINVPFAYQTTTSGIGIEKRCDHVWYQKKFPYSKKKDTRVILHLEGADYHTTIFLNGNKIGEDSGAYHREDFELTNCLLNGENLLIIKCDDDYSKEKPRGKQRWEDKNFGCWYVDTTGIYKTIWLEEVPSSFIKDFVIETNQDKKEAYIHFDIDGENLEKEAILSFDGKEVARSNSTSSDLILRLTNEVELWNVLDPKIYDLELHLLKNGEIVDNVSSYLAFRKLECKNGKTYLNGKRLYQRLILDQGYFIDSKLTAKNGQELLNDIKLMMDIGFNGARKHQKIEDERFYYYADMLGYICWAEMPSMYALTSQSKKTFEREYILALKQLRNHPSIITWVPFNESWGIEDVATNKDTQEFVNHICKITKEIDGTRFCISNDGWEHTKSDLVTIHDYEQDGDILKKKYPTAEEASVVHYEWRGKHAFADNYSYDGEPMLMTEFGGTAFKNNCGGENQNWGYGEGVKDNDDFIKRLSLLVKDVVSIPFFEGFCYTQLSDVEQEVNGLVKEDRTYKLPKEVLLSIFSTPREE